MMIRIQIKLSMTYGPWRDAVDQNSVAALKNEIFDIRRGAYRGRERRCGVAPDAITLPSVARDIALVTHHVESIGRPSRRSSPTTRKSPST
jgi:hypothetical protein